MLSTILVPLDGSALAERAVPFAARLAGPAHARLVLVYAGRKLTVSVIHAGGGQALAASPPDVEEVPEVNLNPVLEKLHQRGIPVETRISDGEAGHVILATAGDVKADLIAMSTHGRSGLGRWLYGSVADEVMRRSPVPVLLVPATSDVSWPSGQSLRILVPLDGSDVSREAIVPACELARGLDADLHLLRVVEPPHYLLDAEMTAAQWYLKAIAADLRAGGQRVSVEVTSGSPVMAIAAAAREQRVDLIAMVTHGSGGIARLVLGSVATGILQRAGVPLLLTRPLALRKATFDGLTVGTEPPSEPASQTPDLGGSPCTVALTAQELDLVRRALVELSYNPTRSASTVAAAERLLSRLPVAKGEEEHVQNHPGSA